MVVFLLNKIRVHSCQLVVTSGLHFNALRITKWPINEIESGSDSGYCFGMSLAEIEEAVDRLSPEDLARLAAHIARRDKLAWDKQIEEDFSPGGKHHQELNNIDAEIDAGNFTPLP